MTDAAITDAIGQYLVTGGPYGFLLLLGWLASRELRRTLQDAHKLFKDCTPTIIVKVDGPVPVYLVPHPGDDADKEAVVAAIVAKGKAKRGEAA